MKILIVYTHPNSTSFNAEILKQVQTNLSKNTLLVLLDLYAEHFDPVLQFNETHKRR